jgi:hypothetical protein
VTWLNDPMAYEVLREELAALREQVGKRGACERAAAFVLDALEQRQPQRRVA